MTNVLFLGGAGFIGSNLIKQLYNRVGDILHISVIEHPDSSVDRLAGVNVSLHRVLLSNIGLINKIIDTEHIDTIIHLVSSIIPGSSYDDYKQEFSNVIFPTIELIEICSKKNIKFVYFSSGGTIYGNNSLSYRKYRESDIPAPISYYGWSKQMMENSVLFMHRTQNLKYLIIRPSNPYGIGQNLKGVQGLVSVALGKILNDEKIEIWGDGSAIRDYIYIKDLCDAVIKLLYNEDAVNNIFNVGSELGYSVNEVINIVECAVGRKAMVMYKNARRADVSSVILDCQNLSHYIDFNPLNLEKGVKYYLKELGYGK